MCNRSWIFNHNHLCKATNDGEASISYGTFSSLKCDPACNFARNAQSTPTVTSISLFSVPHPSSFTLTVDGTLLDLEISNHFDFTKWQYCNLLIVRFRNCKPNNSFFHRCCCWNLILLKALVLILLLPPIVTAFLFQHQSRLQLKALSWGHLTISSLVSLMRLKSKIRFQLVGTLVKLLRNSHLQSHVKLHSSSIVLSSQLILHHCLFSFNPAKTWSDTGKSDVFDMTSQPHTISANACQIGIDIGENPHWTFSN